MVLSASSGAFSAISAVKGLLVNLLVLGRGKTGSLVAEIARERRHHVRVLGAADNPDAKALTPALLENVDAVIDFTTPSAVLVNAEACIRAGKNLVIGTTGWSEHMERLRTAVESAKTGLLYGSNFSIGMNLFFEIVQTAAPALNFEYSGQIFERHHAQKKDAPSGTAITLRNLLHDKSGQELEIVSFREGDVVGMHELTFNSVNDRIYLCHDAKSRRGFADGAVRGAEWLAGKRGFFDFREVWKQL